jgi:hypothetical protein
MLVDSDFDWGQDLGLLSKRLRELGADSVVINYFGTADLTHFGLPSVNPISCDTPLRGYVAASLTNLYVNRLALANPKPVGKNCSARFEELRRIAPLERVGHSMFLYDLPAPRS